MAAPMPVVLVAEELSPAAIAKLEPGVELCPGESSDQATPFEQVGARLRPLMSWLADDEEADS